MLQDHYQVYYETKEMKIEDIIDRIDIKFTDNHIECINEECIEFYRLLNEAKNKISHTLNNLQKWEHYHKIKGDKSHISRGYFKIQSIFTKFNIYNYIYTKYKTLTIDTFHLCEAPGAFLEYTLNTFGEQTNWYTMTLNSNGDHNIPVMHHRYDKSRILNGGVNGDITNVNNTLYTDKFYHEKQHIITADGGFNISNNYDKQEHVTQDIIFAQVLMAILLQRDSGVFILKMYDLFTEFSHNILYIISHLWSHVYTFKPPTSRMGNSEKYLICIDFKGGDKRDIVYKLLYSTLQRRDGLYIKQLLKDNICDNNLNAYNDIFVKNQIKYINNVLGH